MNLSNFIDKFKKLFNVKGTVINSLNLAPPMKQKSYGFSLLELMLALVFIVAASAVAYKMFKPSQTQAAIRNEQERVGVLVDKVMGLYTTERNFQNISTASVAGMLNIPIQSDGTLPSSLKSGYMTIRPGSQFQAGSNDAFEIVYSSVTPEECIGLVKAVASRADAAYVGGPSYNMIQNGHAREDLLVTNCDAYAKNGLALRFGSQKNTYAATQLEAGLCAPETENQQLACPTGNSGSVTQQRTSTCTGTPATPQWSSWVTTSNTCGTNAPPVTSPVVNPPPNVCVPQTRTQTVSCPSGQIGTVLQQQTFSCSTNTWSAWTNVSSSCQPSTTPRSCTPSTRQQTVACPNNQWGGITQQQASTCDAGGNEVWPNDWKIISTTCTATCVGEGNCCRIIRDQDQARVEFCPTGQWGRLTSTWGRTSTCPSHTSTTGAQWGNWIQKNATQGSCNTCTPTQQSDNREVTVDQGCPAGSSGTNTYVSVQQRTRTGTFNCFNGSNGTQPTTPDNWTEWSAWSEVNRTNSNNQCVATPPPQQNTQYSWFGNSRAYGPGAGCNMFSDSVNADQMVRQGILIGTGVYPNRTYTVNTINKPCGPANDGETIIPFSTCAAEGIEGYAGFRCESINGPTGLRWVYQQDVLGGRELYRGPNPAGSGFPLERDVNAPTETCTTQGQTTVATGGIYTAWFGTGANRYAIIQEYGQRYICAEAAYPEF